MAVLDYSQQVPAADRALSILEALAAAPDGLTSAELLAELGGSRSGLYAIVNTLRAREFLVTDEGRHRLGRALWNLLPERPADLTILVDGFQEEIRRGLTDESVALVWPDRGVTIVVAEWQPDRTVRAVYQTGTRRPISGPDTRVMAAGTPEEADDLRAIRQSGIARAETSEVVEMAVPICRDGVRPTAAILCGIPSHRAEGDLTEEVGAVLRALAARLSYRLGAVTYQPYGWAAAEPLGPTRDLDPDELDEFLAGLWGAQLACVRTDGTPHVVPLWYEWDGTAMWLAASPGSSWRAYVAENPHVSVTLDEPWPPLRRAFISGTAVEMAEGEVPGGVGGLRRRLALRYLGKGAEDRVELKDADGWAAIRIVPERLHGRQGLGEAKA